MSYAHEKVYLSSVCIICIYYYLLYACDVRHWTLSLPFAQELLLLFCMSTKYNVIKDRTSVFEQRGRLCFGKLSFILTDSVWMCLGVFKLVTTVD